MSCGFIDLERDRGGLCGGLCRGVDGSRGPVVEDGEVTDGLSGDAGGEINESGIGIEIGICELLREPNDEVEGAVIGQRE